MTGSGHRRSRYFMLSYAHSPPLSSARPDDLDRWVGAFFADLDRAVAGRSSPRSGIDPGFCDQFIPLGSDWKQAITAALETAQVLVPLYSPAYFSRTQSGRELKSFRLRMERLGIAHPTSRIVPVLWTPVLGQRHREWAKEADLFGTAAPGYAGNGLKALLRLNVYRDDYRAVVDRLAERIVTVAEADPVDPSPVDDLDELDSAFQPEATSSLFAVTMAAPAAAAVPDGVDASGYGADGTRWRPFPDEQELPLAYYAKAVAERLNFAVLVVGIEKPGDDLTGRPGVVLIDPWFVAAERGVRLLGAFARDLPPWVVPIIVAGDANERTGELVERAEDILRNARASHAERVARVRHIRSFQEFVSLMPFVIADAERQYLRNVPVGPTEPRPRPKLSRDQGESSGDRDG